jgi:hypothetical protein
MTDISNPESDSHLTGVKFGSHGTPFVDLSFD